MKRYVNCSEPGYVGGQRMRIVIDIPEALYDRVKQLDYTADMYDFADSMYQADIKNLAFAVKNGTSSPKNMEN